MSFANAVNAGINAGSAAFGPLAQALDPVRSLQVQSLDVALKKQKALLPFFEKLSADAISASRKTTNPAERDALQNLAVNPEKLLQGMVSDVLARQALEADAFTPTPAASRQGPQIPEAARNVIAAGREAYRQAPVQGGRFDIQANAERNRIRRDAILDEILNTNLSDEALLALSEDETVMSALTRAAGLPSPRPSLGRVFAAPFEGVFNAAEGALGSLANTLSPGRQRAMQAARVTSLRQLINQANERRLAEDIELGNVGPFQNLGPQLPTGSALP